MFVASLIQATVIIRYSTVGRRLWFGNFIAPTIYSGIDLVLEGPYFYHQPYHAVLWGYAVGVALAYALYPKLPVFAALLEGVVHTSLLPSMYMISESSAWTASTLHRYWLHDSAHLFILLSALMFGLLLGVASSLRDHFERMLRDLAAYLQQLTDWVYDPALVAASFDDTSKLELRRVERTILFMDIRGFTSWSESHDPSEVVQMLNAYYSLAEQMIEQHGGYKMQLIGDEILTRFSDAESGVRAALALQSPINDLLRQNDLGAGIGIHTGDVIEGLIGTLRTRQYGIIGDVVNTAARLQSVALSGEIVLSEVTRGLLPPDLVACIAREDMISVKGKAVPLQIFVLRTN
jgi:class 3 adenylate cyclase